MAVLQRLGIYSEERLDLTDARTIEASAQADWQAFVTNFLSNKSYVLQGAEISNYSTCFSGLSVSIKISDLVLFHSQATTQANGFFAPVGNEPDQTFTLATSITTYVELDLSLSTAGTDTRAFLNPVTDTEYNDTVDTQVNLVAQVYTNTSGFTAGRLPLYKIVTSGTVITSVTDCRNLLFSLVLGGSSPNLSNTFSWSSLPSSTYQRTNTPVTATSGQPAPFQGGDKNIQTFKQWMDAVMSKLLELGGTTSWTQQATGSIAGLFNKISGQVTPISSGAQWSWSGTALSITDTSGSPGSSDVIADIRIMGNSSVLQLERADGQAGTSTISIPSDSVLFVQIPAVGTNQNYTGNGSAAGNYQVATRSAYVQSDSNYWLAYNENGKLVLRNGLKLASGTSLAIGTASSAAPFVTTTNNPAVSGVLRAANNEAVFGARNAANSADFTWTLNTSNQWLTTAPILASSYLASSTTLLDTTATGSLKFGSVSTSNDAGSTTWQANTAVLSDTHGGASIVAYGNDGSQASAGSIEFTAYGTGAGSTANMFRFLSRSGAGTVAERARLTASGLQLGGSSGATIADMNSGDLRIGGAAALSIVSGRGAPGNRTMAVVTSGTTTGFPIVVSAQPSSHGLLIVRGSFHYNGSSMVIDGGEGFSITSRGGVGIYNIAFTTAFADAPVITVTTSSSSTTTAAGSITTGGFTFYAQGIDPAGCYFIAAGQRGA